MSKDEIKTKLNNCCEAKSCSNFKEFTKWESDFIDSIKDQFEEPGVRTIPNYYV